MHRACTWSTFGGTQKIRFEVLFLFRVDDLEHAMQMMKSVHAAALEDDPNAKLPQATFLDGA